MKNKGILGFLPQTAAAAMTETMIEKMARAMYADTNLRADKWGEEEAVTKDVYRSNARAALQALREPTEAMYLAAQGDFGGIGARKMSRAIWTAMIDQALQDGEAQED